MKTFKQISEAEAEDNMTYHVVMLGGSIGDKAIRQKSHLKGEPVGSLKVYIDLADAKAVIKRMNKALSPGEKRFYGIKYTFARAVDGIFTGK